jgi:N-acetylneuraminic acid mutarotase
MTTGKQHFLSHASITLMLVSMLGTPAWGQCQGWWNDDLPAHVAGPRDQVCSAVVDGLMYVFGGHNHNVPGWAPNNRVEAYAPPPVNAWTQRANMPTGRGMAACAVVNGLVYVIGGNNCESNCWLTKNEAYNPQTNTWQPNLAPIPYPTESPYGVGLLSATAVNGRIYCIGGCNSYHQPGFFDKVYEYDPETNNWQSLPPIPYGNRSHHAAVELDGEIYLIGGLRWISYNVHELIADVDVYNPATGQWRQVAPLPTPRFLLSAVVLNGHIYAIGGSASLDETPSAMVEEYDPVLDCWRGATRLPLALVWGTASALGRNIYWVGGDTGIDGPPTDEVIVGYPTQVIGDINGDGVVDFGDINPFVECIINGGCP